MEKPILLICSELTSVLQYNINEMEKKLYKIKEDSSLRAPIFLYSYAMFEGAITMLMTKFCNAFPKFSGSIIDGLVKFQDLPMLAHMGDKEKLFFIIELFDTYSLLFQN